MKKHIAALGAAMFVVLAPAWSQDEAPARDADPRKSRVEMRIKSALRPTGTADSSKRMVESPILHSFTPPPQGDARVEPGKVAWHASFEEAIEAAKTSGKPVLLFQLLGKLDDEWC